MLQRGDNQRKSEPEAEFAGQLPATHAACPGRTLLHTREKESNHESNCSFSARVSGRLECPGLVRGALSHRAGGQESGKPQSLFNGKDLTGWVTPDDKAIFSVENGEIVGRTQGNLKKNEFLVTEKPYRDFVLKAKVKFKNGNSGIQFRSKRAADGAVSGPASRRGRRLLGAALRRAETRHPRALPQGQGRRRWSRTATGTTS